MRYLLPLFIFSFAFYCWWTSPTYRYLRQQKHCRRLTVKKDRQFARRHKVG